MRVPFFFFPHRHMKTATHTFFYHFFKCICLFCAFLYFLVVEKRVEAFRVMKWGSKMEIIFLSTHSLLFYHRVLCYCCVFQHIFHRHEIHASVVSSLILYSLSPRLCDPFSHRLVFASRVDSEDEKVPPKFIVFTLILIHWDLVYIYFRIFASSTRRNVRVSSQKTVCESCVSIIK